MKQEPQANEYLVLFTYKGHSDSIVLKTDSFSVQKDLRKKKIKGQIDEIYGPGDWHYDPETMNPIPF